MLTRTAKLRVSANRNMELTLLMTEQKHVLGYLLNEGDWPVGLHTLDENIEDADGNHSLLKAFAHRIAVSCPEAVRAPARTRTQRFGLLGRVKPLPPHGVEVQRIRKFMAGLQNYEREKMPVPATICLWQWCRYRSGDDNKKEDFKVTSRSLRRENNSRNASFVFYKDSQGGWPRSRGSRKPVVNTGISDQGGQWSPGVTRWKSGGDPLLALNAIDISISLQNGKEHKGAKLHGWTSARAMVACAIL